jgi:hypothetical protein
MRPSTLLVIATSALLSASALAKQPAHYVYTFDPQYAAGVSGTIDVQYAKTNNGDRANATTLATISADLDFSGVDAAAVRAFDGNCTSDVTSYKWHIHTLWGSDHASESFAKCSKTLTGNHYDPLFACGANSEYAGDAAKCPAGKIAAYSCTPAKYAADPSVCEKGDLSGKLGAIAVDATSKKASAQWTDAYYPTVGENTATWNVVLHAVCGTATPRIACAVGILASSEDDDDDLDGGDDESSDDGPKQGGGNCRMN